MVKRRAISQVSKRIACCAIGAYIVILIGILLSPKLIDSPQTADTFGDLADRFPQRPSLLYQENEYFFRSGEIENILVLGVDGRRGSGQDTFLRGQADFLLLMSVDRKNKRVTPILVDRDTMAVVQVYGIFGDPAGTNVMQLCLAHTFSNADVSGGENTVRALSRCLGELPIGHYVTMDIPGIAYLNDAVGGVEVTLEDDFSHLDAAMQQGKTLRLNGKQAELFVRGRMNVSSGTNRFRVQRQTEYLFSLMQQCIEMIRKDAGIIEKLLTGLDDYTDSSFKRAEMISLLQSISDYEQMTPVILQGKNRLGEDNSMEFWLDWDSTAQLLIHTCYEREE